MDRAALDWAREMVLALDPADLTPAAVLFLLREYVVSGRDTVRSMVELGLTRGLEGVSNADAVASVMWLRTLSEASTITDDERLHAITASALPSAIDRLESLVRRSYEPGEGLLNKACAEHLATASALQAAFELSGRIPYAMLAEELLQRSRRLWWRQHQAGFEAGFAANCIGLRVLCGLARLHTDPDYRSAAVVAPASAYAHDARQLAAVLGPQAVQHPQHADDFGCAMLEWFALESNLQ